jgi:hypothetical protein
MCEAASFDAYMQMFNKLECIRDENSQKILSRIIQTCIDNIGKNNVIVYLLRFLRLILIEKKGTEKDKERLGTEKQKLVNIYGEAAIDGFLRSTINSGMFTDIAEYMGDENIKNEPEFLRYDPLKTTPEKVREDLEIIENEINRRKRLEHTTGNYEDKRYVLVEDAEAEDHEDLGISDREGWSWWYIPRSSDKLEARSNDHCGEGDEGSTLYSFREDLIFDGEPATVSHLTFEKRWNGMLAMTKGTSNSKPKPEYYDAIVELLCKEKSIEGTLVDYGFKSETNFRFDDLSPEQRGRVKKAKPYFQVREYKSYEDAREGDDDYVGEDEEERDEEPSILRSYDNGNLDEWDDQVAESIGEFSYFGTSDRLYFETGHTLYEFLRVVEERCEDRFALLHGGDTKQKALELIYLVRYFGYGNKSKPMFLDPGDNEVLKTIRKAVSVEEALSYEMRMVISDRDLIEYISDRRNRGFDWDNMTDRDFIQGEYWRVLSGASSVQHPFKQWCDIHSDVVEDWEEEFKVRFPHMSLEEENS